ncbi:hypothetical protein AMJ44_13240, partial [candidate division WOR-1 bacterium DG_54_3]
MRHLRVLSFILIFILFASAANAARISPEYAPGEVIIKFKSAATITSASINALLQKHKVKKAEKIFKAKKDKIRAQRAPKNAMVPDLSNIYKLKVPDNTDILAIVKELNASPNVEYAEPNYIYQVCAAPNDPYYSSSGSWGQAYDDLWGLKSISAEMAWDICTGSSDIVVAVVDTGVDYEHEDLSTNIWSNPAEIAGNGIDDDGNGYVDDVKGWDFHNSDDDPMDDNGHGTHCSGTIAGLGNNNIGVVGVVWTGKIMPLKALSAYGGGYTSSLAAALEYAAYNGADVINNSWGGYGSSQLIEDAVNYAHSLGCVVVAAAGNDDDDVDNYTPARLANVIAVASVGHNDLKSDFSNWGTKIEVAAPGGDSSDGDLQQKYVNILSLRANGTDLYGYGGLHIVGTNYYRVRGTSMACPHVAGLAALILSNKPGFTNEQVRQVLWESADDLGDPGRDIYYGHGKINAYRALQIDNVLTAPRFYDTPNDFDGDFVLSWSEAIDGNGIAGYELQESIPSPVFSDDAEAGDAKWDLSGFSISTNESLSSSHSFYSGAGDYLDNSMTVKNPVSVPAGGGNLSFWCYYEIETYYDNAYLQISTDKIFWETIATFTGSQKTWQKKSYDLSQYAGESIYIRFRYQTDFIYYFEGFYADDIRVDTVSFSTLSGSIAETQYQINGKPLGDYYYRVRAKSNQGEWSSWSDTEIVSVIEDVFPPESPVMNSLLEDHDCNYTLSWSTP